MECLQIVEVFKVKLVKKNNLPQDSSCMVEKSSIHMPLNSFDFLAICLNMYFLLFI